MVEAWPSATNIVFTTETSHGATVTDRREPVEERPFRAALKRQNRQGFSP